MSAGFHMNGDRIGAAVGESLHESVRLDDHQMHIQWNGGQLCYGFDNCRTHRDIGNEAPVHYVDVDEIGARILRLRHLLAQAREIGGQYRRSDLYQFACPLLFGTSVKLASMILQFTRCYRNGDGEAKRSRPPAADALNRLASTVSPL